MLDTVSVGWNAVESALSRYEAEQTHRVTAQPLVIREGEEAEVTFLDAEPTHVWLHTLPAGKKWQNFICRNGTCQYCRDGRWKPKQRCLFSVVDHREIRYEGYTGNTNVSKNIVRYLELSIADAQALRRMSQRLGKETLAGEVAWIVKTGKGNHTATHFMFIPREEEEHWVPPTAEALVFSEVLPMAPDVRSIETREELEEPAYDKWSQPGANEF